MKVLEVEKPEFIDALFRVERVQNMGIALLKKKIEPFEQPTTIEELKEIYTRMADMREDMITALLEISKTLGADMVILADSLKQDNIHLSKLLERIERLTNE